MSAMGQKRTNLLGHYNVLSSLLAVCYRSKIWLQGKEVMRVYKACIVLALVTGIAAEARAQSTESVVKLPSDMQFKAPVNPGPQTAVLYGDPTKAGVYGDASQDSRGLQSHA